MKVLNKFVNLPKLIKTVWIMLWAILLGLSVIKILFNQWYPIIVEDMWFINLCVFIDSNVVLKYGITLLFYLFSANIIFITMQKLEIKKNVLYLICFNIVQIISYFIKTKFIFVGMFIEFGCIIVSIIMNIKRKTFTIYKQTYLGKNLINILFPIVYYILINFYQLNYLFIKGLTDILTNLNSLMLIILQLDYYIFLLITMIGVKYFMGFSSWGFFFGKPTTELLAIKEEELRKAKPDMKLVEDIDNELKRRETEEK